MFFSPLILSGNDGSQFNHELDSHHCDHMGSQELEQTWTLGQGSTWMSLWKLGSMVSKWVYTWGFCWGYIPLILTIDPNFLGHPSTISAAEVGHGKNFSPVKIDRSLAGGFSNFWGKFLKGLWQTLVWVLGTLFFGGKKSKQQMYPGSPTGHHVCFHCDPKWQSMAYWNEACGLWSILWSPLFDWINRFRFRSIDLRCKWMTTRWHSGKKSWLS